MDLLQQLFGNGGDDPRSQAMGLLGANLMAGQPAQGFLSANQVFAQEPERKMKRDLLGAQVENYKSEIEARKLAATKQQQVQDYMQGLFGGGGVSAPQVSPGAFAPSVDGMGPTMPPQMVAQSQPGSRLANLSIDQVAGLHALGGPNLLDAYKWANDPLKLEQGSTYRDRTTGQERFMPKVDAGIAPDANGFYGALPGYGAAQAGIEGAKARAVEEAKAGLDPIKVYNPGTQREEFVPRSRVAGGQTAQPAMPQSAAPVPAQPGVTGNFSGDPAQVVEGIRQIRDPQERANAMAAFQEQARRTPGFAQGGFAAGPSQSEAIDAKTAQVTAEQTAKDVAEQRKGIMTAAYSAPANIAKYQQIGKLLADVDGGTLTPFGTNLASTANSLGLKIDKNLPNKEAAAALANEAALTLRSPAGGAGMPGAMSDKDREFLQSMTPAMTQTAQGRKQVIDTYVAVQQRNQQIATFARNYEKKHGRLDNGFFDQLQAWSNSNPMFKGQ